MPELNLPAQGETPWGAKLIAAFNALNAAIVALEAQPNGGVDAAQVRAILGASVLGTGNIEVVPTGTPTGSTYTIRTNVQFATAMNRKVDSDDIDTLRIMTKAAHTALATKDARTMYGIKA